MIKLSAFADEASSSIDGQIDALVRNKISLLELRSISGVNVKEFTVSQAKEYSKRLSDSGIGVWSIGSPLGKVDISVNINGYLDLVKHICSLANIFNTKRIRIFSFFNAYDQAEKVFEYLNTFTTIAKGYGVTLCHENEKEVYGDTVERVLKLKENVNELKFIYDPANFIQVGEIAVDCLDKLHGISDYFHIKDVISETDELVPAGYGDGKIDELISNIKDDKVLTLEPHLALFEGYNSIDSTKMKNKFKFDSNDQSFDFAVTALKKLLCNNGYKEINGEFIKD